MQVRHLTRRRVVTCEPSTTLAEAARRMRDANVGSIVVMSDLGVAGIATDRDIVVRAVAEELGPETHVGAVMTRDVRYVYGDTDVFSAASAMATGRCRRLPVLNEDDGVEGMITLDDLVVLFTGQIGKLAQAVRSEIVTTHG